MENYRRTNKQSASWLQDALTSMPVGSKWEIVIPSELGFDKEEQYYDDGRVMIPANSILIFELELLNTGTPEDMNDENKYINKNSINTKANMRSHVWLFDNEIVYFS